METAHQHQRDRYLLAEAGRRIRLPEAWHLPYWDGNKFVLVHDVKAGAMEADQINKMDPNQAFGLSYNKKSERIGSKNFFKLVYGWMDIFVLY